MNDVWMGPSDLFQPMVWESERGRRKAREWPKGERENGEKRSNRRTMIDRRALPRAGQCQCLRFIKSRKIFTSAPLCPCRDSNLFFSLRAFFVVLSCSHCCVPSRTNRLPPHMIYCHQCRTPNNNSEQIDTYMCPSVFVLARSALWKDFDFFVVKSCVFFADGRLMVIWFIVIQNFIKYHLFVLLSKKN